MDAAGEHQLDVVHNIFKKRLNADGSPVAVTKQEGNSAVIVCSELSAHAGLGGVVVPSAEVKEGECQSCYGAEGDTIKCCNTCDMVREAYRLKGWSFSNPDGIAQCVKEEWSKHIEEQKNEGCQLYGALTVNKVAGNFHFAPGKSFQQMNMHVHDVMPLKVNSWNLTHTVRTAYYVVTPCRLSFLCSHTCLARHI